MFEPELEIEHWEGEKSCGIAVDVGTEVVDCTGKGRFGRTSSIKGMRPSMASGERTGKCENSRGWVSVCRERVWCVRWEVREACAVMSL